MPKRILKNGISTHPYFKRDGIYEIAAVNGGLRITPYSGDVKQTQFLTKADIFTLPIQTKALEIAGFQRGDEVWVEMLRNAVYVFKDRESFDIDSFKKTFSSPLPITPPPIYKCFFDEASEVPICKCKVKNNKIVLPDDLLDAAGFEMKTASVMLIRNGTQTWIELHPVNERGVKCNQQLLRQFNAPLTNEMSGLTFYQKLVKNSFAVPYIFRRQFDEDIQFLPVWYSKCRKAIIIEGPSHICGMCQKVIRTTDMHQHQVANACPTCADELGVKGAIYAIAQTERALKTI